MLNISVLSSSSGRSYVDLMTEVITVSKERHFDLLIMRNGDLEDLGLISGTASRMSEIVADDSSFAKIRNSLFASLKECKAAVGDFRISALATYFPDISSMNNQRRGIAVRALANTVVLASELSDWMDPAIVEFVCGTVVEPSVEKQVDVYGAERKLDTLCQSLHEVIDLANSKLGGASAFALGAELEPGDTYLLNSLSRLKSFMARVEDTSKGLTRYVGLNLDIAHMRIAGIEAKSLEGLQSRIVHAHIADHPGIHTHDQMVGSWTNVTVASGGYIPYIKLLLDRASDKGELPFSKSIAIELEGCNESFSIHDSIARLRHLLALAQARYGSG